MQEVRGKTLPPFLPGRQKDAQTGVAPRVLLWLEIICFGSGGETAAKQQQRFHKNNKDLETTIWVTVSASTASRPGVLGYGFRDV